MSTETLARRSIVVAVTGASGALYATRTMAALLEREWHLELVVSDYGRRLLRDELGEAASIDKMAEYLAAKYGPAVRNGSFTLYSNRDLGAKIASGSQAIRMPTPNVSTTNRTQRPTHSSPYQNVRICHWKCDSSHVPRTSPAFT